MATSEAATQVSYNRQCQDLEFEAKHHIYPPTPTTEEKRAASFCTMGGPENVFDMQANNVSSLYR